MLVNTSKCCAANTADLWSINLQGLENSYPIIASRKGALVRSFCTGIYYLLKEHLLAQDIVLVKASFRNSLVWLVTGMAYCPLLGCCCPTGGPSGPSPWTTKRFGQCWWCFWVKNHCYCSGMAGK